VKDAVKAGKTKREAKGAGAVSADIDSRSRGTQREEKEGGSKNESRLKSLRHLVRLARQAGGERGRERRSKTRVINVLVSLSGLRTSQERERRAPEGHFCPGSVFPLVSRGEKKKRMGEGALPFSSRQGRPLLSGLCGGERGGKRGERKIKVDLLLKDIP